MGLMIGGEKGAASSPFLSPRETYFIYKSAASQPLRNLWANEAADGANLTLVKPSDIWEVGSTFFLENPTDQSKT
jgi:hypothetical protein